ncbi:MAG: DUF3006 domain-containing protein [Clostridia bacterium]|nr:DUF3006 domain-containing protein [Clostridia bacterium]MBQ7108240.1 DUF3006 domain-containing protein [Clostridia bacterium]MBQ9920378.1 DUF3006 domain-containing protein [Clostridia bacterium]
MIIVDRFENDFAVIEENGVMKNIPRSLLGDGVTEGSVIVKKGEKYFLDEKNSAARRKEIAELQNSLFED